MTPTRSRLTLVCGLMALSLFAGCDRRTPQTDSTAPGGATSGTATPGGTDSGAGMSGGTSTAPSGTTGTTTTMPPATTPPDMAASAASQ